LFGDIREGPVTVVFVEVRSWRFSGGPVGVEAVAVGEVNIEPAVIVVVEECEAAAFGFNNGSLVVDAAPDVRDGQAGLLCYIDKLDWAGDGGFDKRWIFPFPEWGGKSLKQSAAEQEKGRA